MEIASKEKRRAYLVVVELCFLSLVVLLSSSLPSAAFGRFLSGHGEKFMTQGVKGTSFIQPLYQKRKKTFPSFSSSSLFPRRQIQYKYQYQKRNPKHFCYSFSPSESTFGYPFHFQSMSLTSSTFALNSQSNSDNAPSLSSDTAPPTVLVPMADGSEEIESVTIIDTLVRGGINVIVANVMPDLPPSSSSSQSSSTSSSSSLEMICSRGVKITADYSINNLPTDQFDCIALPGGLPGANHLRDSSTLTNLLKKQANLSAEGEVGKTKIIAAICASPSVVLAHHNLLSSSSQKNENENEREKSRNSGFTCYPAEKFISTIPDYQSEFPVYVNIKEEENTKSKLLTVTSQGPGTTALFALKLIELLVRREKAIEVANGMLVDYNL